MKPEQKFLNDLYTVKRVIPVSVNKITAQVEINPSHSIFSGHFPGNPVLPGAATLQILKELVSEYLGCSIRLTRGASIKYLSFVDPRKNILLDFDIELKENGNGVTGCTAGIHHGDTVFCSFKGEFTFV
ncbi:MAG TPA: hypothetical protein PKI12_09350 [Bacteroidales bacterium]|nr:hypothetical protein [Bacteroidales bacterium]